MGGLAFKDKARRILREEIDPTLEWVAGKIGLPPEYVKAHKLGSAGKNETSGDVDINMDETLFDIYAILDKLKDVLGEDNVKDWTHVNQIFTCVPILGDPANGFTQIDFMFGDVIWQEFSYFSPGSKSAYKGLFRTELIKAAVAFCSDWTNFEDNTLVCRVGPTFFHDRGLVWRYRHRPIRKDRKGRVKTFAEVTEAEFIEMYPQAHKASQTVVKTPSDVAALIFNDHDKLDSFESYETLSTALKSHYSASQYGMIMEIFLERLNSLKVDIPKDVFDEISTATIAIS
jgi:hypothetical protein